MHALDRCRLSFCEVHSSNQQIVDEFHVSDFPAFVVEKVSGEQVSRLTSLLTRLRARFSPPAPPASRPRLRLSRASSHALWLGGIIEMTRMPSSSFHRCSHRACMRVHSFDTYHCCVRTKSHFNVLLQCLTALP